MPEVSAGSYHTCAVRSDGQAVCWGGIGSNYGQVTVPGDLGPVRDVVTGGFHTCAIRIHDQAVCWGAVGNDYGQVTVPSDLGPVSRISAGDYATCAVELTARLVCWGGVGSDYGQVTVPGALGPVRDVSAGSFHACAIKINDRAACWGGVGNDYGQVTVPSDLGPVSRISAGPYSTCAIKSNDQLACWGGAGKDYGQVTVPGDLGPVRDVVTGGFHTCAIRINDLAVCWGGVGNDYGQVTVPSDLGPVRQITASWFQTCAVKVNGAVVCWGSQGGITDFGEATVPAGEFGSLASAVVNFGDPEGLDFGDVTAGLRSPVVTVPVQGRALAPGAILSIKSVGFAAGPSGGDGGGAFSIQSQTCAGTVLSDGSQCTVRVRFSPKIYERDAVVGAITITDDSAVGSHTFLVSGMALAPPTFLLRGFSWTPPVGLGMAGTFNWETSDRSNVTLTLTQPVKSTVVVRKGRRKITRQVTVIKPVKIASITGQPGQSSSWPWSQVFGNRPAAKGNWKATITAVSARGRASMSTPVTIR